jgi:hypothetical protein
MAFSRLNEPIEPMTLGNMRANGVRSIAVSCWQCHHEAVLCADCWPDHMTVPTFGPRMVCTPMRHRRRGRPAELARAIGAAERRWHRAMAMSGIGPRKRATAGPTVSGCGGGYLCCRRHHSAVVSASHRVGASARLSVALTISRSSGAA